MGFPKKIKEEALVKSGRCCCICNKFVGVLVNCHRGQISTLNLSELHQMIV